MDDEMIIYDTENGQYLVPLNLPLLEKMPEKVDLTKDYKVKDGQLNTKLHEQFSPLHAIESL